MRPRTTDLFGEVPVTGTDLYAWLFAVADMDPMSPRAAEYVRAFYVIEKIVQAKSNGSFDEVFERAAKDRRFQALCAEETKGVGDIGAVLASSSPGSLQKAVKKPPRSRRAAANARVQRRRAVAARREATESMLNRLPKQLPPLEAMLKDIGDPSIAAVSHALQVHETTFRRWLRSGEVPHTAKLAIFWLTRWGMSAVDCETHNLAVTQAALASALQAQVDDLQARITRLTSIGEFGAANDPEVPNHRSSPAISKVRPQTPVRHVPFEPRNTQRRVFTGQPARLRRG